MPKQHRLSWKPPEGAYIVKDGKRIFVSNENQEVLKHLDELHEKIYGEAYGTDRDKSTLKDSQRRT
mgnify:FL=1